MKVAAVAREMPAPHSQTNSASANTTYQRNAHGRVVAVRIEPDFDMGGCGVSGGLPVIRCIPHDSNSTGAVKGGQSRRLRSTAALSFTTALVTALKPPARAGSTLGRCQTTKAPPPFVTSAVALVLRSLRVPSTMEPSA